MSNYAFNRASKLSGTKDGTAFEGCNFFQCVPGTKILEGVSGLVFRDCNLINCSVPKDAIVDGCNVSQVSFCSHLHPEYVQAGLPECQENCAHVVSVEEIQLQGTVLYSIYQREDQSL
jgi:hypothetical protein